MIATIHDGIAVRKWKRYAQFRPSGHDWLGLIPEHWQTLPLKRRADIRYGLGQPPEPMRDGLALIRATNVKRGRIAEEGMMYINPEDVPASRDAVLRAGDIIVVRSGAYTGDSAIVALLEEKRQAVVSHAVTRGLDPNAPLKDSGVPWLGMIPNNWSVKPLKMLIRAGTSISYGIVQPGDNISDGVPFVQTTNMTSGDFSAASLCRTSPEIASAYPRSKLSAGDLLLGIRASIGAAHIVPQHLDGANLSRGVARISLGTDILEDFACQFLRGRCAQEYWALARPGSTFNEISIATVRELPVIVPPIEEQRRIVTQITHQHSQTEEAVVRIRDGIARLQEYRTALISAAVTGQIDVRGEV